MADDSIITDIRLPPERRTSLTTILLVVIGIGLCGLVGYDAYLRGQAVQEQLQQQEQQAVAATQANQEIQRQLQNAILRVAQSDANAQASQEERVVWQSLARASAGVVAAKPLSLYSLQRAVFGSADTPTRQFLREYFKKAENLDRVRDMVVFVASQIDPPPQIRRFSNACRPIFTEKLPQESPTNPDALWCYEFLKRREAEGGDLAAWQRLLAEASAEFGKKS